MCLCHLALVCSCALFNAHVSALISHQLSTSSTRSSSPHGTALFPVPGLTGFSRSRPPPSQSSSASGYVCALMPRQHRRSLSPQSPARPRLPLTVLRAIIAECTLFPLRLQTRPALLLRTPFTSTPAAALALATGAGAGAGAGIRLSLAWHRRPQRRRLRYSVVLPHNHSHTPRHSRRPWHNLAPVRLDCSLQQPPPPPLGPPWGGPV